MRRWLVVFALLGLLTEARADDFDLPTLRGTSPFVPAPPTYTRWGGFYFGGDFSRNSALADFSKATSSLISYDLRQLALENEASVSSWEVLGKPSVAKMNFGGFLGYNSQWDDLVLGIELGYNRASITAIAPVSPLGRVTAAGGNSYDVAVTGSGSLHITDYATLRGRAGWNVGNFLPYLTAGAAVGRVDFSRSATVSGVQNEFFPFDPNLCPSAAQPGCAIFSFTSSENKKGAVAVGWAVGGGFDFMVMPNAFVRAEFEYVKFLPLSGITAAINSGRVGAGLKF